MCGIAAFFYYNSSPEDIVMMNWLRVANRVQRARGPDGEGIWVSEDAAIGLGHRRLAIIDLSPTGAQPMTTEDGLLRITYNGEIYNYKPLRLRLEALGYRFRSNSDTEVLLHLYCEYGQAMMEHLRGMYAFALWDKKKSGLFLVRDPFGIKPLYYVDDGYTIRVAETAWAGAPPETIIIRPKTGFSVPVSQWPMVEGHTGEKGHRA